MVKQILKIKHPKEILYISMIFVEYIVVGLCFAAGFMADVGENMQIID